MKIAIQGHPTRGKEVIQILESLGGLNSLSLLGTNSDRYYFIYDTNIIMNMFYNVNYEIYTLEEFEKEFPFKIGDKVTVISNIPYKIVALEYYMDRLCYRLDNGLNYISALLKPYKEMKEERNITLTLDKAKEWYNKGGELKEIALQAFTEKELNSLPRSWEEFVTNHARMGYYISADGKPLMCASSGKLSSPHVCPSKKSAEAHLAMIQLEQLRDCWRQGNIPQEFKYKIKKVRNKYTVVYGEEDAFLSFCDKQTAEEFLECFRDLIEKAGDLI